MNEQAHERLDILGVKVSAVSIPLAVHVIQGWIQSQTKTYVCVAPVSTLVDCQRNADYRTVVNRAGMVTPDGMPVVWLGKSAGSRTIDRTYGPDLMQAVTRAGQSRGLRHFWYGGQPDTLELLEQTMKAKFPGMILAGKYSPPMTSYAKQESADVIALINEAKPDILWVGLGSPKQDFWMSLNRPLLDVPVIVGVGAAFDFLSGQKPQAPRWMQRSGLEWTFRLASEPRRLWRRYLIGNAEFLFYLTRDRIRRCVGRTADD